jgi:uncharacterized membrane protein
LNNLNNTKMKKLRMILSALAFVFAVTAAFAFVQQKAWRLPFGASVAVLETITEPSNTDQHPCALQTGTTCRINGDVAYDTKAHAEAQGSTGILKYN